MPYSTDDLSLRRQTDVEFYVAGGPGGQHRNKTSTGVRLKHRPSGVRVQATERRSRAQNLTVAWERLRARLAALNVVPIERKPTRPSIPSSRYEDRGGGVSARPRSMPSPARSTAPQPSSGPRAFSSVPRS